VVRGQFVKSCRAPGCSKLQRPIRTCASDRPRPGTCWP
jgi:hypothetical protein